MAEEFIRSVLDTEEECRKKEANAKSLADTKKQNAKIEAERIILEAKKSVDEMLQHFRMSTIVIITFKRNHIGCWVMGVG